LRKFPFYLTSSVDLLPFLLQLSFCLGYHGFSLLLSLLKLVSVYIFHVLNLILEHLHLFPHSVVVPIFFHLLVVRLNLLDDAGRLFQF